jgi:hypothetical protein
VTVADHPTRDRLRRHKWNEGEPRYISASESGDGNERTEKTCSACGLVKITVHPPHGFPWHEWRHRSGHSIALSATPPCITGEVEP